MTDQPIDLDARRKAKETETTTDSPTLKQPKFNPDTYFAGVMEQNRKAKAKEVEDKAKRNKLTKRRYKIKDTEK